MSPTIDRRSPIPYYLQLADLLRAEISVRAGKGGAALPSENILLKKYEVSRATVRSALNALEREGLIYRRRGKGSFVAVRRIESDLTALVSTTEDMERRGWDLRTKVLARARVAASPKITRALDLGRNARVYQLSRLRLVEHKPLSLQTAYLPVSLYPALETHDLSESLYQLTENVYHLQYWMAREVLRARGATRREAALLEMRVGAPVLYCERTTYSRDGAAIEFLQAVWRGDRYDFTVNLARP